jgi:hypothetical protein
VVSEPLTVVSELLTVVSEQDALQDNRTAEHAPVSASYPFNSLLISSASAARSVST